jgi:hypothetical protein
MNSLHKVYIVIFLITNVNINNKDTARLIVEIFDLPKKCLYFEKTFPKLTVTCINISKNTYNGLGLFEKNIWKL